MKRKWEAHGYLLCAAVFTVFYAVLLLHTAYFGGGYITQDSANYLREAAVLRAGGGFNVNALAGGSKYFAAWPIGYPAAIALVSVLFSIEDLYLASKVVAILSAAGIILLLARRYRTWSILCFPALLHTGIREIYYYTWSENLFLLMLTGFLFRLADILSAKRERRRDYAALTLWMVGAFLTRYFGAVTLFFTGVVWLALLLRSRRELSGHRSRSLLRRLALSGIAAGAVMAGYLIRNFLQCGYATGIERDVFTEDRLKLAGELFRALYGELCDLFFLTEGTGLSYFGLIGGSVLLLFFGLRSLRRMPHRSLPEGWLLLTFALCYDAAFIFLRFRTTMDPFGSRFFGPASFIAALWLAGEIGELLAGIAWGRRLQGALTAAAALLCVIAACGMIREDAAVSEPQGYERARLRILASYQEIPPRSVCLYAAEVPDYLMLYFRPDVNSFARSDSMYLSYGIGRDWGERELLRAYAFYDYICIRRETAEAQILSDEGYSKELREALERWCDAAMGDEEYIVIPTGRFMK